MLKKFIDSTTGKIILWPLAILAGLLVNPKPAIHWLTDAACKQNALCGMAFTLGILATALVVTVYIARSLWRQWKKS